MNRRRFLQSAGAVAASSSPLIRSTWLAPHVAAEETPPAALNTINLADPALGAKVVASSNVKDPPWGYLPENVFGDNRQTGWHSDGETIGAWIEIQLAEPRPVREVWLLAAPLAADVLGQDVYLMTYPRTQFLASPRKLRISFSNGKSYSLSLEEANYLQMLSFPEDQPTSFVRFQVEEVWPRPGATETGLGKIHIYSQAHAPAFEIVVHSMYDARGGKPVQAATLHLVNPNDTVHSGELRILSRDDVLMTVRLGPIPAHAVSDQSIWIPAPFENSTMDFELSGLSAASIKKTLEVPSYNSYFDHGSFDLLCTNHNDLGWLNTQALTADYRSSALILPALDLLRQYPEFLYSMESTAYLIEFLERHPERREEMAAMMRANRFTWGASYVQLLQLSAGPEKLVRQFYFGRRWLKKEFPGVDTHFYMQSDPPNMSLQMPQILAKAGVKYCMLGRLPFGFYRWRSPDGSSIVARGFRYVDPSTILDLKDNSGWLECAEERADYYQSNNLPRKFVYDYTSDYLPPQPDMVPYVRRENKRMADFAAAWNNQFRNDQRKLIQPPRLGFTTPEKFLDEFTAKSANIPELSGDWPCAWAYYDEPSNREALLNGREAHNSLIAAEQLYAGMDAPKGFAGYPTQTFEEAWRANIWPDHGWGGNRGTITDEVYAKSYAKSRDLAESLLSQIGTKIAASVPLRQPQQTPIVVYNPLSWPRTDCVDCAIKVPDEWTNWTLTDQEDREIPCEFICDPGSSVRGRLVFIAENVPSVGYRSYFLRSAAGPRPGTLELHGQTVESDFYRLTFGTGGIKELYNKKLQWDVLRTEKFYGGEVLEFAAPGNAWEDTESVGMQDFDRTAAHDFPFTHFTESLIRKTAVREAQLNNCMLRETFHLYRTLERIDIDLEILNWNGRQARELRVAFPINLDQARLSYEVPFGTVEMGKDELDFTRLPSNADSQFSPKIYGGTRGLSFREAINWIDASSVNYAETGCLVASDSTVHIFQDETAHPVTYPVLQHVLLSVRKSLAWNPEYWYTQRGNHRYRMSMLPHAGDWRMRYRDALGFNHRLLAFVGESVVPDHAATLPLMRSFLSLDPNNLILTAMKRAEDDGHIVIRFYEAEGSSSNARIKLSVPIRHAWKTNLIEDNDSPLEVLDDGSISLPVKAWEIVTVKVAI
jgi:alpha-mannosidase